MTREEFFLKAVIELSAAQMVAQPGGFKAQMDRAIEIAQYLTTSIYGESKRCNESDVVNTWYTTEI